MKSRIFSSILTLSLITIVGLSFAQVLNKKQDEYDPRANAREGATKVTEYKGKSRDNLKPYRYDASKVTHFSYSGFEQKREIEVLMFNGTEYRLCFNGQGAPKPVAIQIFDKPESNQARVMIQEISNASGNENIAIESNGINQKYNEILKSKSKDGKDPNVSLKRIYVDYVISANDSKEPLTGFMVLSYGYKNI